MLRKRRARPTTDYGVEFVVGHPPRAAPVAEELADNRAADVRVPVELGLDERERTLEIDQQDVEGARVREGELPQGHDGCWCTDELGGLRDQVLELSFVLVRRHAWRLPGTPGPSDEHDRTFPVHRTLPTPRAHVTGEVSRGLRPQHVQRPAPMAVKRTETVTGRVPERLPRQRSPSRSTVRPSRSGAAAPMVTRSQSTGTTSTTRWSRLVLDLAACRATECGRRPSSVRCARRAPKLQSLQPERTAAD
jgi:hypothetical protein